MEQVAPAVFERGLSQIMAEPQILVVDDDAVTLQLTAAALRRAGFPVMVATNARTAFRLLETHPGIALLITDIVMPGLDGLMLADMVKLRHPDVRVIYATGFPEITERQPGYRYGPTLSKPIDAPRLESTVRKLLARPADRYGFRPGARSSAEDGCRC
jgi:CheY-like chemotaxis protein